MATNNASNFAVTLGAAYQMTFPNQPGFLVYNANEVSDVTGDGRLYTPGQFDTEALDRGNNFAANTFIAPVTGIFLLSTSIYIGGIGAGMTNGLCSIKTTGRTFTTNMCPLNNVSASGAMSYGCKTICSMTAGDTAIVEIQIDGGAKTVDYKTAGTVVTQFSGVLLS